MHFIVYFGGSPLVFVPSTLHAIAQMSHEMPSAWEVTHMVNSDSFFKSRNRILLKNHTLQQSYLCFQLHIRHNFIMVSWNLVLIPDIGLSHLFSLPALPACFHATQEQSCSSFFIVVTPKPGIMFGT